MEYLKANKQIFNEHPGLNYQLDNGVDLEWLLVKNHQESLEYHMKHFSFFPEEVIEKLAQVNFNRKVLQELKQLSLTSQKQEKNI